MHDISEQLNRLPPDILGRPLEVAVENSLLARKQDYSIIGRIGASSIKIDGNEITLDGLIRHKGTKQFVGIEIKNTRNWYYRTTGEIWYWLKRCTQADAVPVFIGRKIQFLTTMMLDSLGATTLQMNNQLIFAKHQNLFGDARDKDFLGYHDIRVYDPSTEWRSLGNFFSRTLVTRLNGLAPGRWDAVKDDVLAFCQSAQTKDKEQDVDEAMLMAFLTGLGLQQPPPN